MVNGEEVADVGKSFQTSPRLGTVTHVSSSLASVLASGIKSSNLIYAGCIFCSPNLSLSSHACVLDPSAYYRAPFQFSLSDAISFISVFERGVSFEGGLYSSSVDLCYMVICRVMVVDR